MLGKREKATGTTPVLPFSGFSRHGSFFRSEVQIDNPATRFARYAAKEIHEEFLSPSDVRFMVLREDEDVRSAFRDQTLEQWATLSRFWHWPLAGSCTQLEEYLRSHAGTHPWLRDENLWSHRCDDAERKYHHESRLVEPQDLDATIRRVGGPDSPHSSGS